MPISVMWLKRIFGKKDEHTEQPVDKPTVLSLREAKNSLSEKLSVDEKVALKACEESRDSLRRDIEGLKAVFAELQRADVVEPRAAASKTIKDGFVQRATGALSRAKVPDLANIDDAQAGLSELERVLGGVSVGPREVMHLQFFFDAQLSDVAARLRVVFETIARMRSRLSPVADKRTSVEKILHEVDASKRMIADKTQEIFQLESDCAESRNELSKIETLDVGELNRLRGEFSDARRIIAGIDQQVASILSPTARLLRRFGHGSDKRVGDFISRVESAPADAFYEDDARMKEILASSISAAKSGKINADPKELRRSEEAMARFSDLMLLKGKRSEVLRRISEIEFAIGNECVKERENARASERAKVLGEKIVQDEVRIVNLKREISEAERRLGILKPEIGVKASAMLGKRVEIDPDA